MILRNNTEPRYYFDGCTNLYDTAIINNTTSVSNDLVRRMFLCTENGNNKINIFYSDAPFSISIRDGIIDISGKNDKEILLGIANLYSLKEYQACIPNRLVTDIPKTNHREFMLDIARNFISLNEIKKIIDEMFRNRLNYLHLHFSDDQNYAIESKVHPELNTKDYLKQSEILDLVLYAKERGIEIIPEFDMPGHLNHLLEINPDLRCNPNEGNSICFSKNRDYLYDLVDEICGLFPCEYFHIGGDEIGIKNQCNCPKCKMIMAWNNIQTPKGLAAYFINDMAFFLQKKGKKVICWNDALTYGRINEDIIIQKWFNYPFDKSCLSEYKRGRKVIIASATDTYIGGPYALTPLRKIYGYVPEINDEVISNPFGVSAHLWTETISDPVEIERGIFPSLQAFSENAWLQTENLDYESFLLRMSEELKNLDFRGISYTNLSDADKFNIKELREYLKRKLEFKNYTEFSKLALLKMISEYFSGRNNGVIIRKKHI